MPQGQRTHPTGDEGNEGGQGRVGDVWAAHVECGERPQLLLRKACERVVVEGVGAGDFEVLQAARQVEGELEPDLCGRRKLRCSSCGLDADWSPHPRAR